MDLEVNKTYLINTKNNTLKDIKLKLVSICNWNEAIRIPTPMNILDLAINEKIIDTNTTSLDSLRNNLLNESDTVVNDTLRNFKQKKFYHCIDVSSSKGIGFGEILSNDYNRNDFTHYVLWEDIIDFNLLTVINTSYQLKTTITVSDNIKKPLISVLNEIKNEIASRTNGGVNLEFNILYNEDTKKQDLLKLREEELDKAAHIINEMNKLMMLEPIINTIISSNFGERMTEMIDTVDTIKGDVERIAGLVS